MFEERKKKFLKKLFEAVVENEVDADFMHVIDFINSLPNCFTTSSCSGRIILLEEGKTKKESKFLFKCHSTVSWREVWDVISSYRGNKNVWFKVDPVILHVDCKTLEDAKKILDAALRSGWKRSGIMVVKEDRFLLELESTEHVEAIVIYKGRIVVNEDYIKVLVEVSNEKLLRTKRKIKRFYEELMKSFSINV